MNKSLSKQLGELFAHFQDLIDTASHTLIKRLNEDEKKRNRLISFFSTIGDSYFKKYSEIKKDS
jgi:hypothetical protein|tara:strand:+ start:982 stop:1173 length:192 start_codon:yes stop_codon:yes gene_type:complete